MVSLDSLEMASQAVEPSRENGQTLGIESNGHHVQVGVVLESGGISVGPQRRPFNYTDMCNLVESLMSENVELRAQFKQCVKIMENQRQVVSALNAHVDKATEKQKSQLEECIKRNEALEMENANLKKEVENFQNKEESASSSSQPCSNCDLLKQNYSELEEQFSALKMKLDENELQNNKNCCKDESSITTIVADDESDYAIIVQEDLMSQHSMNLSFDKLEDAVGHSKILQKRISGLVSECDEQKVKIENLETILGQKEEELRGLKLKQDDLTLQSMENLSLVTCRDEQNKALTSKLKESEDKVATLMSDLITHHSKLEDVQNLLKEKEAELKILQEEHIKIGLESDESMSQLYAYNVEKQDLLSAIRNLHTQVEQMTGEIEKKKEEAELQKLKKLCADLIAEKTNNTVQISELTAEKNRLQEQVKELQVFQAKYNTVCLEKNIVNQNAEEVQSQNIDLKQKIQNVQKNLETLTSDFQALQKQNDTLKDNLKASENNFTLLSQEHQYLENSYKFHNPQQPMPDSQNCFVSSEKVADLLNEIGELTSKLLNAETQYEGAIKTIQSLQEDLVMAHENSCQIPILQSEIEKLKQNLATQKQVTDEIEENFVKALQEIENLKGQLLGNKRKPHRSSRRSSQPHDQSFDQALTEYGDSESSSDQPERYGCPFCELLFDNSDSLSNHVERHLNNEF